MGVDPQRWGESAWALLHRAAMSSAPVGVKRAFFKTLSTVLPCGTCQKNIERHMSSLAFPKSTRQVGDWWVKVHNRVNESLRRPEWTVSEAHRFWAARPVIEDDYRPFLSALAASHPGARASASASASPSDLVTFVALLKQVVPHVDWAPVSDDVVRSRAAFRRWIEASGLKPAPRSTRGTSECSGVCAVK